MNKHIQSMKDTLVNYRNTVIETARKIEENNNIYNPEYAEKENNRILESLSVAAENAKKTIADAQSFGLSEVDSWGTADGLKITDDAKLLEYGVVDPAQFSEMVQKYQDNFTMLQLLSNYAEKKNGSSGGFTAGWNYAGNAYPNQSNSYYDTSAIPTVEGKKHMVNLYAEQASNLIDSIGDFSGKFGSGANSPFVETQLANFGVQKE